MDQWYALHTKPRAEYQVAAALQRRGVQTYLPEIDSVEKRQSPHREPFFPCYLFVRVDFEKVGLSSVQWTPGVRRLVSFGDKPASIPEEVIDLLQQQLQEIETNGNWPRCPFKPGDTVRIIDGPFRNMQAVFSGSTTACERVQVLLDILGHTRRVHLPMANLQETPVSAEEPVFKRARSTRGRGRRIKSSSWEFV